VDVLKYGCVGLQIEIYNKMAQFETLNLGC